MCIQQLTPCSDWANAHGLLEELQPAACPEGQLQDLYNAALGTQEEVVEAGPLVAAPGGEGAAVGIHLADPLGAPEDRSREDNCWEVVAGTPVALSNRDQFPGYMVDHQDLVDTPMSSAHIPFDCMGQSNSRSAESLGRRGRSQAVGEGRGQAEVVAHFYSHRNNPHKGPKLVLL
jgi:hypothetical protein